MKLHGCMAILLLLYIFLNINEQQVAACGQLQSQSVLESRITFGQDTHSWPWHAAIYHRKQETEFTYICGGTLASSKFVLTAAHCISAEAERISVSLGRLDLNASQSSAPFIKVTEILVHPNYNPDNNADDIAIITLATDVLFNRYIQPVCMWRPNKIDLSEVIGKLGTVVGWGLTENGEKNLLQEASLPVVSTFMCLESNRDLFGRHLTAANFCAGWKNGTSVCTGDSGGSMTFQEDGRFYIRGIVSVGANILVDKSTNKFMCDPTQYAIFTDVAQYLPWIRETIECETAVQCDLRGSTDTCSVSLIESGCKIIFDENFSVAVTGLDVTGDWSSAVPDLSSAGEKFTKLEKLGLRQFTHVERSTLSAFKNIKDLLIQSFPFTQIDADTFVDLTDLEEISIINSILRNLPAGLFRKNNKIRSLHLPSNSLQKLHSDVFQDLRNIEVIKLKNNILETLPANIFRNNEKMVTLTLRSNLLRDFHEDLFSRLTDLVLLDLADNQVEYLPSGLFRSNTKLNIVYLSDNRIKRIEVDLTTMPQLVLLELEQNDCINETFDFREQSLSEANEKIHQDCSN